jgi:Tfp pilus assembly protein PilN
VNAVNLLPPEYRRARASGKRSGSAYVALAVLGTVLVAVLAYAVVAHQVASRTAEADRIAGEADAVEAEVAALAPFGEFSQLKQARIEAVRRLAAGRLDWERLARDLAHVLPRGTWLSKLEGSATGAVDGAPGTAPATGAGTPTLKLVGCAKDQPTVATALVRLRRLSGATDVQLDSSKLTESASGAAGTEGCGRSYAFEATIELEPVEPAAGQQPSVEPVAGGGS